MRTNAEGRALIKGDEDCKLEAYADPKTGGEPWSIGWGSIRGVKQGLIITQAQADARFEQDLADVEAVLDQVLELSRLGDNQYSALVSFCYNVGFGRKASGEDPGKDGFHVLRTGDPSTMLKCLLAGDFEKASDEFPKWCDPGSGVEKGLLKRRLAEMDLFLKPDAVAPSPGDEP